jgi:hypothetical protein
MPHPGELNLDDLAPPVEVEVKIDGKEYVLRQAPVGEVTDILLLATGLGSKDRPAPIDGPADVVSLVVARCLYERTDQGERPVPLDTILSWPHRIVRPLFEKAKETNEITTIYEHYRRLLVTWDEISGCLFPALRIKVLTALGDPDATEADYARLLQEIHAAGGWPEPNAVGPTPGAAALADAGIKPPAETPQADGTIDGTRIWLDGQSYRMAEGLRGLLSYLLGRDGATEDAVIRHCGYSGPSHLHKRLKDLRDALKTELKKAPRKLSIKTEETRIYCRWKP